MTITLGWTFGDIYYRHTEADRFFLDARFFADKYVKHRKDSPPAVARPLYEQLEREKQARFYIFDFEIIPSRNSAAPCPRCEFIKQIDSVPIFLKDDALYLAVFELEGSDDAFVFSENGQFFSPEMEWYEDSEVIYIIFLFTSTCFVIGLIIYFPLRGLQKNLNKLVVVQRLFGDGELSLRADDNVPHPVSQLSLSFNNMANDIEDKIKQSQIFAQAISHEVRTPLSRIQLTCDIARKQSDDVSQQLFDDVDTYIEDINHLTENIVLAAKLASSAAGRQEHTAEKINIVAFCEERLNFVSSVKGKLFSRVAGNAELSADPTLARLIVDNIMKNADTHARSKVWVTVTKLEKYFSVVIEDDGIGIPVEKHREIFLAFARLDASRNSESGGFGLGLTIASNSAKILGWEIKISSRVNGGARFTILIPVKNT